jgi:hypothetical protein
LRLARRPRPRSLRIRRSQPDSAPAASSDRLKASPTKIKADEWNQFDIEAIGDHFTVRLNGSTVLDGRDQKHGSGLIGFNARRISVSNSATSK